MVYSIQDVRMQDSPGVPVTQENGVRASTGIQESHPMSSLYRSRPGQALIRRASEGVNAFPR